MCGKFIFRVNQLIVRFYFVRCGKYLVLDVKILSLWAIWNLSKGTWISWADIRLWGTRDPSI